VEVILRANIVGTYNVFEAARRNGARRIVFATSNHAVGFYDRDDIIDHRVYPKPDSRYGVSRCSARRSAACTPTSTAWKWCASASATSLRGRWTSAGSRSGFRARSRAARRHRDRPARHPFRDRLRHLRQPAALVRQLERERLGYRPQDDSEPWAEEVLKNEKPGADPRTERFQGGTFVIAEHGGDPTRAPVKPAVPKARARRPGRKTAGKRK